MIKITKQVTKFSGAARVTSIIAYGTFSVALALTALIFLYDILNGEPLRIRFWIGCGVILYIALTIRLIKRGFIQTANWLLIVLYELLATMILINWGLSSTVGILTASFAILLPGIFMRPRSILTVTLITLSLVIFAHSLHLTHVVTPVIYIPPNPSSALDVIAYATILSVFALVSWVSAKQSAQSLQRALTAEENLKQQKENLAVELTKESIRLREAQLQQTQQLYKFATIGQSTAATLHELSNYLSILNLDIDDMKQQHRHSKAIASAEEVIVHINRMVRKTRVRLSDTQNTTTTFDAFIAINQTIKDCQPKIKSHNIRFIKKISRGNSPFFISGNPLNLMQCLSILINNAIEACSGIDAPYIKLSTSISSNKIIIKVVDNGIGISKVMQGKIFQPTESSKPAGMGIGLYIAKHLIESQFMGKIEYLNSKNGAAFQITIKRARSKD